MRAEDYLHGSIVSFKNTNYRIAPDSVTFDPKKLTKTEFVFAEIAFQNKTLYFSIDKNTHQKLSAGDKHKLIGFWHTIISNQKYLFNIEEGFGYRIEYDSFTHYIYCNSNDISIGVVYKTAITPDSVDLSKYKVLEIKPEKFEEFVLIRSSAQIERDVQRKWKVVAAQNALAWLVVIVAVGAYYFYKEGLYDQLVEKTNNLDQERTNIERQIQQSQAEVIDENRHVIPLAHIDQAFTLFLNSIKLSGEVSLKNPVARFELPLADEEVLRYVANAKQISYQVVEKTLTDTLTIEWEVEK